MLVSLLFAASAYAASRYVWQDNPNPGPLHTHWPNATHLIHDVVDSADAGDEIGVNKRWSNRELNVNVVWSLTLNSS